MTWTITTHAIAFGLGIVATLAGIFVWLMHDPWPEDRTMAEEDDPDDRKDSQ